MKHLWFASLLSSGMRQYGTKSSECDETLVICVTAKRGTMTSAVPSAWLCNELLFIAGVCMCLPHCFDSSVHESRV